MTDSPAEAPLWSHYKLTAVTFLVLAVQFGLIFWLVRYPAKTRPPATTKADWPTVFLSADRTAELPGINNPTLFVLANRQSFSGPAWMNVVSRNYPVPEWSEPPRPLALPVDRLGTSLDNLVKAVVPKPFELPPRRETQPDNPPILSPLNWLSAQSSAKFEGDLATRPLLSPLNPGSWPSADLLSNSVVQLAVDPDGRVFSAALLKSCGLKDADASAVTLAKSARFKPLPASDLGGRDASQLNLDWGRLIVRWHTMPPPPTNSVAGTPK
jgi:TonB family protein